MQVFYFNGSEIKKVDGILCIHFAHSIQSVTFVGLQCIFRLIVGDLKMTKSETLTKCMQEHSHSYQKANNEKHVHNITIG